LYFEPIAKPPGFARNVGVRRKFFRSCHTTVHVNNFETRLLKELVQIVSVMFVKLYVLGLSMNFCVSVNRP